MLFRVSVPISALELVCFFSKLENDSIRGHSNTSLFKKKKIMVLFWGV
jgi:hypothetical protein